MKVRSTAVGGVLGICMIMAFVTHLQAFSVGDVVVQSRRGMPFLAEIPLTLSRQERDRGVAVTIGDEDEYQAEGLSRSAVIDQLEVSWITGARDVVVIASTVPIQETAFDLILSITAGQATIVRTYHVGFPERASADSPSPVRPPASLQRKPPKVTAKASKPANPKDTSSRTSAAPAWLQGLPERYGPVGNGMTLFGVVKELGVPGSEIWQTLVLIWQANKNRFYGSNLHGLQTGMVLTIPPDLAEGLTTMSRSEAQRIVADQWDIWQEIRRAISERQHTVLASEEKVEPRSVSMVTPPAEPVPASAAPSASSDETPAPTSTVVLPAEPATPKARLAEMESILQGLERLLGQQLPQAAETVGSATFVRVSELQTALQGLEERLARQFQNAVRKVTVTQQAAQTSRSSATKKQNVLEQMFPPGSMLYVLVVENALLLLLAAGILWRWFRSRA